MQDLTNNLSFFKKVVDESSEIVYVINSNTYEILFINKRGLQALNYEKNSLIGHICYSSIYKENAPCSFCPHRLTKQKDPYTYKYYDVVTDQYFDMKSYNILIEGEPCLLTFISDVSQDTRNNEKIIQNKQKEEVIIRCVNELLINEDLDDAINNLLKIVAEFYDAERAFVVDADLTLYVGVKSHSYFQKGTYVQNLKSDFFNLNDFPLLENCILNKTKVFVDSVEDLKALSPNEYHFYEKAGLNNSYSVAFEINEFMTSVLGFYNVKKNKDALDLIDTVSYFLRYTLTKNIMERVIKENYNKFKKSRFLLQTILDKGNMDCFEYHMDEDRIILGERLSQILKISPNVENFPESFIYSGIIAKESTETFREIHQKLKEGATEVSGLCAFIVDAHSDPQWLEIYYVLDENSTAHNRIALGFEQDFNYYHQIENLTNELALCQEENTKLRKELNINSKNSSQTENLHQFISNNQSFIHSVKGKKAIVADNNILHQKVLGQYLNQVGIEVEFAERGREVLELINGDIKNLRWIFMDSQLSDDDCFLTTKIIRSKHSSKLKNLTIIGITSTLFVDVVEKMKANGMNCYILKPITQTSLIESLVRCESMRN